MQGSVPGSAGAPTFECEVFKTEINYLAHHVSKRGVLPSKKKLEAIACKMPFKWL